MSFVRNLWYVAAWTTELPDAKPIARTVIEQPIVLWRKPDGAVVAMEDRCPHRHAPLSLGRVSGETIQCMYHGVRLSAEGRCLSIPAMTGLPPNADARIFPVEERDDWIWVWMGDPAKADRARIPKAHGLRGEYLMSENAIDYVANYELINDNLTDLSHVDFSHATSLAPALAITWADNPPRVRQWDDGLHIARWFENHRLAPILPYEVDTYNSYAYLLPGIFVMKSRSYPAGTAQSCGRAVPSDTLETVFERVEQQAVTPIDPVRTRYLYATGFAARFAPLLSAPELVREMMRVVEQAFEEDRQIIEAQQRIWDLTPTDRPKAFLAQDKAPSMFRRLVARRLAEEQV